MCLLFTEIGHYHRHLFNVSSVEVIVKWRTLFRLKGQLQEYRSRATEAARRPNSKRERVYHHVANDQCFVLSQKSTLSADPLHFVFNIRL
nr:hypothetical protein CFP56_00224 [Quercus suber]